ncbi:TonB-dependent receptor [Caulobacter endophyticus]|uniref:TonB-dependent siderophore receptor n=1 Tax=Caulobacter endophyticus TaxID=2172652 RepID=A0A2T9KDY7_9CAUL|nr:TonB-dependent receptor [Caulobacter endophyticus]PVM94163.1 TonB-dependent siderophore receptor [Caulobacter endophyticus]
MSPRLSLLLTTALLAPLAASPVLAQEAAPTAVEEVIVTGSQVRLPPAYAGGQVAKGARVGLLGALDTMDAPFSVTSYTEELIRNQQALGIGDVLQNDPTVRVSKGFGNFQELYVVRGFPVYSDDMTYNGLYGVLPRQFVAAELVERVDVFRGANSFLNGAAPGGSGIGGAFNLVPKRAGSAPLTRFTAGWDGGEQLYAKADVARRFGQDDAYGARLNLGLHGGETAVDGEKRDLKVIGLGLDRRGERARFSADLGWQDHHIDAPRPTVTPASAIPKAPSADKNFAQDWTYTDERQLFGAARGEFDLTDTVSAWAAVGGRKGKEDNVLANPTAQADGTISAYRFDNVREDTILSADVGLRAKFATGSVGHSVVASIAQVDLKSRNAYAFSSFAGFASNLYTPVQVAKPAADFFIGGSLSDPNVTERAKNRSVAIADTLSLLDETLLVTVGVRYQEIWTRTYDYNTGVGGAAYDSDATTPAVAVVYKPDDRISLYANYAEALVPGKIAPTVVNGVTVANGNEILSPFRAEQAEAGVKYDSGAFGGALSVFRTTKPSEYFNAATRIYSADGEQENKGVELTAYGELTPGLRLIGGATWMDTKINRAQTAALEGKSAIGVPEFQANLNVEYDIPALDGLTLDGRLVYTGSQAANEANTVELGSWTRLDIGARYDFEAGGRPVTLRARVENLADKNQWVAVGGYPGANYLTLGAPRTVRLSVTTDF